MEIFRPSCLTLLLVSMFLPTILAIDPFSEALLSLKSEIIDVSNSLSDWILPSESNPSEKVPSCSWSGVTCENKSTMITGLDLSMKNLGGSLSGKQFNLLNTLVDLNISYNSFSEKLPTGIFNLTSLKTMDISRNNFSGQFPKGISNLHQLVVFDAFSNSFSGDLPTDVSRIETLKVLNLAGSYFSGQIPSEYGSFKSLEFIHLAGNFLSGKIPIELGKLQTVAHMEIGYNNYEGNIPFQLGNMSELQYLDIAGANLSGFIPKEMSNLTKLESIFLFRNQLTGLIPEGFSRILTLTNLDLSDNLLSGPIPESFSELKNLKLLSLMYNYMNGTVPQGIAELPSLETLLIWNNLFYGALPNSLGRYSQLKWVDVSTNNFGGTIPPDICSRGFLSKLILFSNHFTGGLSPSLTNCSSLIRLRLENNSFSGDISLNFSNLPDVTYVDLSRNRFTGGIPMDIAQAFNLQYFNVSNNPELGGIVPIQTWSLPLLQNFSASSCNINGILPQFQFCRSLSAIELSSNKMMGTVSKSILKCQFLERIDLSFNNFNGYLPEELASLHDLAVLDVSHNNFTGPIPLEFANSSSLKLLNVSFNHISGLIPSEKRFKLMGSSAFVGNPELCGAPLQPCPRKNPNGLQVGIRRTQKFAWVIILCALVVICIAVSVIGVFYFQKKWGNRWKMVSFPGIPNFTANDVLRSLNSTEALGAMPPFSKAVCKAVLPTGIMVLVKKIEVDAKSMGPITEFITRLGNTRHKNLTRLLGLCYNKHMAYILYDYLPNGNLAEQMKMKRNWDAKYNILIGIARGLRFIHHECYPVIPHGDLRASNIVFDENMDPHLAEFGFKFLQKFETGTGEYNHTIKEELEMDILNFGQVILEIITNGRITNVGEITDGKPKEALLREIYHENEAVASNSMRNEIKLALEVALSCTTNRPCDRPSMEEVLKLLSGSNQEPKSRRLDYKISIV